MRKLLVLGGAGAMGKYLVPLLAMNPDNQVFVTSRSRRVTSLNNVIHLQGDAKDKSWLATIMSTFSFDVIFDFMLYKEGEFLNVFTDILRGCGHYFYFSSSRVLSEELVPTETGPVKLDVLADHPEYQIDTYGLRKAKEEKALRASGSTNFTIIRPSMTFSSNRFQFFSGDNFDVLRASKGVPTLLPESAVFRFTNLSYGKNVAKMLAALVGCSAAFGQTYHAVTKSMTWGEVAKAFNSVFGMSCHVVPDEEYLEVVDLDDGRIIDRFRNRRICNDKILRDTGLTEKDFGSLEENLQEAWEDSDIERYKLSRASIRSMARFDEVTKSSIDIRVFSRTEANLYAFYRKQERDKLRVGTFVLRPNEKYWAVSKSILNAGAASVVRLSEDSHGYGWLNFRSARLLREVSMGKSYKLVITIISQSEFEIKPFLHFFGKSITRTERAHLSIGRNEVELLFDANTNMYSDVAIAATEVQIGARFDVASIKVCEV